MDKHFGFFFFFIFSSPLDIFDAQLNKCAKRAGHGIPSTASLPWSALPYPLVAGSIHYATARAPLLPSPSSVNSESDPATLTFWLLLTYWLARLRICPPPPPPTDSSPLSHKEKWWISGTKPTSRCHPCSEPVRLVRRTPVFHRTRRAADRSSAVMLEPHRD